jgi:hypothetical protein
MSRYLQHILDGFYWLRKYFVTSITYLSLRLFGSEIKWSQLLSGIFVSTKHADRNLDNAGDLSLILTEAKNCLKNSEARLLAITDKCKNLLALSSILLTLVTVLLTKSPTDSIWIRILFLISALAFFDAVILLMVFFDVGVGMSIDITQKEVDLPDDDFKKCLINLYFKCRTDLDNRTDYLVEVYKVSRFLFLSAFTALVLLFSINLFLISPKDSAKAVALELWGDTNFLQSVRGEKGTPGVKGDPGSKESQAPKETEAKKVRVAKELSSYPVKIVDRPTQSIHHPENILA